MKERTILGVQMTTGVDLVISLFEVSLPPIHRIVQSNRGRRLLGEIDRFDTTQSAIGDLIESYVSCSANENVKSACGDWALLEHSMKLKMFMARLRAHGT
jgi:hypothetical protein